MMKKYKVLVVGVSLFLMAVLTNSCTRKETAQDNILRTVLKDDVKTLDPANAYDSVSAEVIYTIYDTLLQYKYLSDAYVLEPRIADGMPEYSQDGLTVTVKIKKGIFYADDPAFKETGGKGREVKAQDFVFAFKRLAIPTIQSQGAWIFEGKVVGFSEFEKKLQAAKKEEYQAVFDAPVEGFTAKDDNTLVFKLTQPYPILNYFFAMTFTSPIPPEAVNAYADKDGNLRDHPIGSGPFILKSWETGQKIIVVKNPNYKENYPSTTDSIALKAKGLLADAGKPMPFLDGIRFDIIKEEQPRLLKFQKGEIDTFELTKDTFRASMKDADHVQDDLAKTGVSAEFENSLVLYYVQFNMNDKILQNKYLRQAISSAIDREKWIDTFDKYKGVLQTEVAPQGMLDRVGATTIKYNYDVAKGKELLAKAGYPEGKGLPILNFEFRGADTKYRQMGEFFVGALGAIGIKANAVLNTFPAYLEKAKQGNIQIAFGGWNNDFPDIENDYQLLYGPNHAPGPNDANYNNPEYDALYRKLAAMPAGTPGRREVAQKMEEIIQEDVPWAYGYYQRVYRLKQATVKNFRVVETNNNKYKYFRLDYSAKK